MLPIRLPAQEQQSKRKLSRHLKNTLLVGTICGSGLLTYTIVPFLFHACAIQVTEFISLIQQPQMANAMQSLDGIMQILGIPVAIYTFCLRRTKEKRAEDTTSDQAGQKEN